MSDAKISASEQLGYSLKRSLWALSAISLCVNVLLLFPSLYSMQLLGRVLTTHNMNTMLFLWIGALVAYLCLGFMLWARSLVQDSLADWFERSLKPLLVRTAMHRQVSGITAGQALGELQTLRQFIAGPALTMFLDAPWSLLFAVVLWMMHPYLVLISLAGGLVMLSLAYWGEKLNRQPFKEVRETQYAQHAWVDRLTRCIPVIRAMRMENTLMDRWKKADVDALSTQARVHRQTQMLSNVAQTFKIILQSGITTVAAILIINNELNASSIMAISMLTGRVTAPFEQAIGAWLSVIKARDAYKRLQTITSFSLPEDSMVLPEPKAHITVSGLFWRPEHASVPVLKNISFTVEPGTCVAVLGHSGAGKSSLISLLSGIETPTAGNVRFDGADMWRQTGDFGKHIGYMPQTIDFFPGSIRDNICRMDPDAQDEDIIAAAQAAGAHELILGMPQGYQTSPEGINLPHGQRQRIGLARALYGPVKLLLLDEPNAHLDEIGERALMESLQRAKASGVTVFVVSHKTGILAIADKCLILNNGELRAFSDAEEVRQKYTSADPSSPRQSSVNVPSPQQTAAAIRALTQGSSGQPPQLPNNTQDNSLNTNDDQG